MDIEEIEIDALLEVIRLRYGHDFRQYSKASLGRRIRLCQKESGCNNIAEMIPHIIHKPEFFSKFFQSLTVNVTEMFRDPKFFLALREKVIPYLKTFPYVKVWCAGISTGEEVYSLSILLKEEGLYDDKLVIYATDFNDSVLATAQRGIYPVEDIRKSTKRYQEAGGLSSFSNYYRADYDSAIFDKSLRDNIVFANHNIVTDSVFGEMNLILCRNVLIYFDRTLQDKAYKLFHNSLGKNGFLCLGNKESIKFSNIVDKYKEIEERQKIYQKY